MKLCLQVLNLAFLFSYVFNAAATVCQRHCGGMNVPYPFGLGNSSECYKDSTYKLICNETLNPPVLSLGLNIPIYNISIEEGVAFVNLPLAFSCYTETGDSNKFDRVFTLGDSPFTFSSTDNMFTALGCNNVIAYISDGNETGGFASGCLPMCGKGTTLESLLNLTQVPLYCSGEACCQTRISRGLKKLAITLESIHNRSEASTCSYGFLSGVQIPIRITPERFSYSAVVLDWAIGKMTCEEAMRDGAEYICGSNTNCLNSKNGPGYRCSCNEGFQGNPYTRLGCMDINECSPAYRELYPCKGRCKNIAGNYTCNCPLGKEGEGKIGCSINTGLKVTAASACGSLLVVGMGFLLRRLNMWYKKKIQEKRHLENSRLLLKHISVKVYTRGELEKATRNFDSQRLLGEGGNGWVHRGTLEDSTDIAVKKSKVLDQNKIQEFLNEVDIVSKINHKNVVKLLGVCMETEVPMLVYEFVPNGTLSDHIRGKNSKTLYSWPICLRIAAETAAALDYMHSLARPPIIHRDIKSTNILLDDQYMAKVADFGASKLIRIDGTVPDTQGQGTMGYLDPEYLQTGELTTKSDVYGFGVVLMELLSKEKPISRGVSGELISLVKVFTSAVEENGFNKVLKFENVTESECEEIETVAKLAVKCASMSGKDRPTMKEASYVLDGLCKEYQIVQTLENKDESASLLDEEQFVTTIAQFSQ